MTGYGIRYVQRRESREVIVITIDFHFSHRERNWASNQKGNGWWLVSVLYWYYNYGLRMR